MNELKDIRDFVGRYPPFDGLAPTLLDPLCGATEITYHPAGSIILAFGEPNDELCLVRRGAISVWTEDENFVEKRARGECFGIPSLLTAAATRSSFRSDGVSGVWMPMMTRSLSA